MNILWICDNPFEMEGYQDYFINYPGYNILNIIGNLKQSYNHIQSMNQHDLIITTQMKYLGFCEEYGYKEKYTNDIYEFMVLTDINHNKRPIIFTAFERLQIIKEFIGSAPNYFFVDLEEQNPMRFFNLVIYKIMVDFFYDIDLNKHSEIITINYNNGLRY